MSKLNIINDAIATYNSVKVNGEVVYPLYTESDKKGDLKLFYISSGGKMLCDVEDSVIEEVDSDV